MGISVYPVNTSGAPAEAEVKAYNAMRQKFEERYQPADGMYKCTDRLSLNFLPEKGEFSCKETLRAWDAYMAKQQQENRGRSKEKTTFDRDLRAAVQAVEKAQGDDAATAKVALYKLLCKGERQLRSWFLGTATVGSQVCDALAQALAKDPAVPGYLASEAKAYESRFVPKHGFGR